MCYASLPVLSFDVNTTPRGLARAHPSERRAASCVLTTARQGVRPLPVSALGAVSARLGGVLTVPVAAQAPPDQVR